LVPESGNRGQIGLIIALRLSEWINRAMISLPVPVSPESSTVASVVATSSIEERTATIAELEPSKQLVGLGILAPEPLPRC
jgi:hypothetical protein